MNDPILAVIQRGVQRGGVLSIADLMARDTLSSELAAWLAWRVWQGDGWLVGATPGGAGKTTVMNALLGLLPAGERVLSVDDTRWTSAAPPVTLVCAEIGPADICGYLWGAGVRALLDAAARGCRVVSNLHADTLEQARHQVAVECGAGEPGFRRFDLFIPIELHTTPNGHIHRRIPHVHQALSNGWRIVTAEQASEETPRQAIEWFDRWRVNPVDLPSLRRIWLSESPFANSPDLC